MTATGEEPTLHPNPHPPVPVDVRRGRPELVRIACPYLVAADGRWRGVQPTRDHRCGATLPMAEPALTKQRETCLTGRHASCATYVAARNLELAVPSGPGGRGFWPEIRGTLVSLDPARGRIAGLPGPSGKAGGQALLIGLMVLAFIVLVIARTTPPSSGSSGPSFAAVIGASASIDTSTGPATSGPSGTAAASPSWSSQEPTAVTSPAPSIAPSPTVLATVKPTAMPIPADAVRYRVKSGDTLSSIAAKFNTTVKKLKVANGIAVGNIIRVGQVLIIP